MADDNGLSIEWTPSGRKGTATLTARFGDEVLAVETFNPTKSKARVEFADAVCDGRPGIDRKVVENELLRMAAEAAKQGDGEKPSEAGGLGEIDVSRIIRPERFITPEVSGLAVPTMTISADKPQGRWLLYLRWADGRRECLPIPPAIDLPEGGKVWIHPQPTEPAPNMVPGWSAKARGDWLKGSKTPDPSKVFRRLCERIAYFIDLPKELAPGMTATLALWVVLSYVYSAWDAVPYLYLGGPLKSGKTRVLEVLLRVVFRPLFSSSVTGPTLFRTLHNQGGTLLLDEAEQLKQTHDPEVRLIRSMLLAGYKRGGKAHRMEQVGDGKFKTLYFDVYGPKALACIAGVSSALASRVIPVIMFRAPPGSKKPRRQIDADPACWQSLRDELHALTLENGSTWLGLTGQNDVCPEMDGRDYQLWQPLLALAWWIESHGAKGLLKLMQDHALASIDWAKDDQTPDHDETLLKILADEIRSGHAPRPSEILDKAKEAEPEFFKKWTARGVSACLKRYRLTTNKSCGRKIYGRVTLDHLRRVQESYVVDLGFEDETDET